MKLIAFFSLSEMVSIGLVSGEPAKGPLLKAAAVIKPTHILVIKRQHGGRVEELMLQHALKGVHLDFIKLSDSGSESMTDILQVLKNEAELLTKYADAALLSSGTPQERAVFWVLKHQGILKGEIVEPPTDYTFTQEESRKPIKLAEPAHPFEENETEEVKYTHSWEAVARKAGCIGKSARFRQTLEEAVAMAGHPTPILLMGETGSGKEVLARFIHALSPRAQKPMVAVNCAALPENLAESILFGHEKGSFTGAYKRQTGKFEQADGGTLFLDELGELSLANQAKLLRAIETRMIDPLGGSDPVKVDVRLIAATNRNLAQEVAAGRFREDLYYRLRAGEIDIPPLRERSSDVPMIALFLLERINATLATPKQFSKPALKFLEAQRWPGNVRDLMNTIERAALLCPNKVIEPEDFKVAAEPLKPAQGGPTLYPGFAMEEYLQKVRQELFDKALKQAGGSRSEAARLLGITPQAMHKYLKLQEKLTAQV